MVLSVRAMGHAEGEVSKVSACSTFELVLIGGRPQGRHGLTGSPHVRTCVASLLRLGLRSYASNRNEKIILSVNIFNESKLVFALTRVCCSVAPLGWVEVTCYRPHWEAGYTLAQTPDLQLGSPLRYPAPNPEKNI